ncbi:hypothetical protein B0J12DRAFT_52265 [Macrophomina phaseolina]|uniref:Secreted protein n=1 Tax=Macrophomina phaseolina TaxID=35725 RepID=A0ABQ8GEF8_9PEZI|nr:hypothetical protein B0J12DRAFT_52265 [Macrophomina phaseolina]
MACPRKRLTCACALWTFLYHSLLVRNTSSVSKGHYQRTLLRHYSVHCPSKSRLSCLACAISPHLGHSRFLVDTSCL